MLTFFAILSLYGSFTIIFGLISLFIKERMYISETVISTLFGMIIGERGLSVLEKIQNYSSTHHTDHLNPFQASSEGNGMKLSSFSVAPEQIIFYLSRLVISLQVVAVGSVVPFNFIKSNLRTIIFLIGPLMLLTYILSASIIYIFTASSLPICFALILAACVTPTDPVLASSILKGKFANRYIPRHLRNALIVESGINDGLAYPLLTLPLFFIQSKLAAIIRKSDSLDKYTTLTDHILLQLFSKHPLDRKDFFTITKKWFLTTLFYEIVFACFYGLFIGFIFKKALLFSKRKNLIDKENDLSFLLGLSLVVTGTTGLLASDDILASFFCGIAFSYTTENIKEQKCKFNEENNKIECEIVNPDDDNQYFQGDFEHDQPVCSDDFYEPSPQEEAVVINIDHQGKNITETTKLDSTSSSHSYINQHANGVRSEMNNYFHQNTPASTGESHLMRQLPNKQHNNNHDFYEILDILINSMFFMIFGYFIKISPKYFILSIILLLIKRLPIFMVLPLFRNKRERFFAGWYGPVGVGALFFMSHFKHELFATHLKKSALTDKIENIVEEMEIITNTIVFVSVLLHGTTAIIINLALRKKKLNEEEMYFVSESEISEIN